jgi:hypothetical protein
MNIARWAEHFINCGKAIWLAVALCGTGYFLLRRFELSRDSIWEDVAFSFGLGYGIWGTALLFLGLAGGFFKSLLLVLTLPPVLFMFSVIRRCWRDSPVLRIRNPGATNIIFGGIFIFLIGSLLPNILVPETFYDSLIYHLALPDLYLFHHRIIPTPYHLYSGFPALPQMISAVALSLDSLGVVARLIHWGLIPVLGCAFLGAARRWKCGPAGLVAICLFCSVPAVVFDAYRVTVSLELTLFQWLSCYCLVIAVTQARATLARWQWYVLAGAFLGFAFSTKYTAWVLPAAFGLPWLVTKFLRRNLHPRLREMVCAFAIAVAVLSPWVVKNVAFYGNPIYPYMTRTFHNENADYIEMSKQMAESYGQNPVQIFSSVSRIKEYLTLPWYLSLEYGKNEMEYLSPAFLMLLPILFLTNLSAPIWLLGILAAGGWFSLSAFTFHARYLTPNLAILAFPLAAAVTALHTRWLRIALLASLVGVITANVLPLPFRAKRFIAWPAFLGQISSSDFLTHSNFAYYSPPPYAGFRYLNENVSAEAKVLIFGDGRGFYLKRDYISSTVHNASPLEVWANSSPDAGALRKHFAATGITHLLVNMGEILRQRRAGLKFTPFGRAICEEFWKTDMVKVFEAGSFSGYDYWVIVYRLRDANETTEPAREDPVLKVLFKKG